MARIPSTVRFVSFNCITLLWRPDVNLLTPAASAQNLATSLQCATLVSKRCRQTWPNLPNLREALLRLAAFTGAARRTCFSAGSRLVDLTEQLRWGMFNGAGVVLSATNAFESQNTSESRIVTKTKTGKLGGGKATQNPHPPRRSQRVGTVNEHGEDDLAITC